ncbi:MAG TPA: hypothetical protein VMN37_12695 [Gemmatimonadales bacterium]|nr:hypothetical protein [Gemmatimonadales bacterium]
MHARDPRLASILLLLLGLAACGQDGGDWVVPTPAADQLGPQVRITGVIRRSELEGGFYSIEGDDGVTYDPANLPQEFQQDGLRVELDARRRDDMAGIHQVGPIVQVERIRRR